MWRYDQISRSERRILQPELGIRMANFLMQLRTEISRVAKREIRAEVAILKKAASQSKSEIAALKRRVLALESSVRRLTKAPSPSARNEKILKVTDLRFRAAGLVSLRKRLGLSGTDMAKLIGVSQQTVFHWESGKTRPRQAQLLAIAEIRKLGKKRAAELLQHR